MNKNYLLRKKLERVPFKCPECGQDSDSMKFYGLPDFYFFIFAYSWQYDYHVACAKCMRKKILDTAVEGLAKAHILWPIVYLPFISVNFVRTFVKGHSEDIIDQIQLNQPK